MKAPLDPFSRVTDEQSHWDPEWYSWLQDLFTTTTQLQANVVTLQTALATQQAINTAQQANNTAQQAAITALQNPPPGVSPGLIFLSVQTANNSPTLVFTGMNSTYAAYQFHATGLRPSVNNQPLYMQMKSGWRRDVEKYLQYMDLALFLYWRWCNSTSIQLGLRRQYYILQDRWSYKLYMG